MMKLSLFDASNQVRALEEILADGGDIDAALKERFVEAEANRKDSINRRIWFWNALPFAIKSAEAEAEQAKELYDSYRARVKTLEAVKERFKENTLALMDSFPEFVFEGHDGTLKEQAGVHSVDLGLDVTVGTQSISNVLMEATPQGDPAYQLHHIPLKYLKVRQFVCLDREALLNDLKEGKEFEFAKLKRARILRVALPKTTGRTSPKNVGQDQGASRIEGN